jgi:hypothetical protein
MKPVSPIFSHDELLATVRNKFEVGLTRFKIEDKERPAISNADCLMSGMGVFTFKYPSLLVFDQAAKKMQLC